MFVVLHIFALYTVLQKVGESSNTSRHFELLCYGVADDGTPCNRFGLSVSGTGIVPAPWY
jgi:hypothetical protein